jgi:3-dehydroquinate synthase
VTLPADPEAVPAAAAPTGSGQSEAGGSRPAPGRSGADAAASPSPSPVIPPVTVHVRLPALTESATGSGRGYSIVIGSGAIAGIGQAFALGGATRAVVVADGNVLATHARAVIDPLEARGIDVLALAVPPGEASKSVEAVTRLWDAMAAHAVDRGTHVVAVGGGVVGDLAGFAAATFARGLPCWQVATTLIAQVDSAIGGKTGINLSAGKNLVGAFWQPVGVICDTDTLATLPDREFRSGLAEVVKYGVILDPALFEWLEGHVREVLEREPPALRRVVADCCRLKASVVEQDERERTGLRAALNYGHTFGHAYEAAAGYGHLLHGEAVAMGMDRAAALAARLGRIPQDLVVRQRSLLDAFGLPTRGTGPEAAEIERLVGIMRRDKKSVAGRLRFVLPSRIGSVEVVPDVDERLVREVLAAA